MFTNISWTQYIIAIVVLVTVYYLFVIFRYFRDDITRKLSSRAAIGNRKTPTIDFVEEERTSQLLEENERRDLFAAVEELIAKVKTLVSEIDHQNFNHQDFIGDLQTILASYPELKSSEVRSSVSELISSEIEKNGTVILSEQDVEKLW